MAIRLALGATRAKVVRQLLTESLLLSLVGGALGLLLAVWGVEALTSLLPKLNFSFQSLSELRDEIRVNRVALLFTLAVSILTGLIFGLAPGWQAAKTDRQRIAERRRAQWRRGRSQRAASGAGDRRDRVGAGVAGRSRTAHQQLRAHCSAIRPPGYDPQGFNGDVARIPGGK